MVFHLLIPCHFGQFVGTKNKPYSRRLSFIGTYSSLPLCSLPGNHMQQNNSESFHFIKSSLIAQIGLWDIAQNTASAYCAWVPRFYHFLHRYPPRDPPPGSVSRRGESSKQLRVLETLCPWAQLKVKYLQQKLLLFSLGDKKLCGGDRKGEAHPQRASSGGNCSWLS